MTIEQQPEGPVISIQMLRGIAATMVLFVHFDTELLRLHHKALGSFWLASGVDIFFVISGFIMWTSVHRRKDMTAATFLKNRAIRILPLYWFVTASVVAIVLLAPNTARSTRLEPVHVLCSFLFLPARHPVSSQFWPVLVPGWSLNYEMLFYVVLAVALYAFKGRTIRQLLFIGASLLALFICARAVRYNIDFMNFYASPITVEFFIGILIAVIVSLNFLRRSYWYSALVPLGFCLLWASSHLQVWSGTVFVGAALVVAGAVLMPAVRPNPMARLGDASYSLYLTHGIVLSSLAWLIEKLSVQMSATAFILLGLACAYTTAFIAFLYFEAPVTAALKSRSTARTPAVDRKLGLEIRSR